MQTVAEKGHNPDSAVLEAGMVYQYLLRNLLCGHKSFFSSDYERLVVIINYYQLPKKLASGLKKTDYLPRKLPS